MNRKLKKNKIFAVYKGDNFLAMGTAIELAKKFNVKEKTVLFWAMPVQSRRNKGNAKVAIVID